MQQTEKYQFNLIETSDPFSPEPLNANMEKTEAALTAQAADTAAQFAALPRVHIQNWTGDGTDSRTLTFPFKPKVVFLFPQYSDTLPPLAAEYGLESGYRASGGSGIFTDYTWNGNSVTLSCRHNEPSGACNGKGHIYLALAIG